MDKRLQDILAQAEIDRQNSLSRIAEIETAIQQQQAELDRLSKIHTRTTYK